MSDGNFVRVLGAPDVISLGFGAMVGWGWVVLAGSWVDAAGAAGAMLAFAIGGIAVILIGLTYAELAAAMPLTGGEHVYSHRALGMSGSFFCTWAIVLGYVSVVAFEAVALPTVIEHLFPNYKVGLLWNVAGSDVYLSWAMVGSLGAMVMTWINIRGVKSSALLQKVVTFLVLFVGVMLITGSLFNGQTAHMEPLFVGGAGGVMAVLIMTPFMFVGFDVIPQAAEEINLPHNTIGKILIFSVLMAVAWYILIILAVALAMPAAQSGASGLATADAMTILFGGSWAGKLLVIAGIGGIITSWNAFLIGGSRAVYAMAHSKMLPEFLGKLHPAHNTPVNAILMVGALSVIAPFFGRKSLVWLVNAGGLGIVVAYAAVTL
ncbi:MAG: APC family permease, partial [Yoonia sp.]